MMPALCEVVGLRGRGRRGASGWRGGLDVLGYDASGDEGGFASGAPRTSTTSLVMLRGLTTSRMGSPSSSASLNLTPTDSWRSS